jgi:hypothetical protein
MNKQLTIFAIFCCAMILSAGEASKYSEGTTPLHQDHDYLQKNPAPDFWLINSHYVGQFNNYSCSAASVAAVVNALLSANNRDAGDSFQYKRQQDLVKQTKSLPWKQLVSEKGHNGKHGLNLMELQKAVKEALGIAGLNNYQVVQNQYENNELNALKLALEENERSSDDIVLIHFLQDVLTGAKGGPYPHISVIGAYDKQKSKVLIMDVDRDWYAPYWVPVARLLNAINTPTPRFGKGGLVIVRKSRLSSPGILNKNSISPIL